MEFNIKTRLPSGRSVRIPELKNKDFFTILKFSENEDYEGLNNFFIASIFKGLEDLDIIDKFYILLLVRMVYVDPELIFEDKNKNTINFNIENILEKIDLFEGDFDKIYKLDKFELELGMPNLLYFDSLNDIYLSVIKKIEISDKVVRFDTLTEEEREQILSHIPNSLFSIIKNHINLISDNLKDFIVIDGNEEFNIQEINLNVLSNGIISFLLSIFSTGLTNFFEMLYIFTNKLGFTAQDFYNLTPLDSKVILNIYKKELAEKEEELKNQSSE
jgi:hypothetical protein